MTDFATNLLGVQAPAIAPHGRVSAERAGHIRGELCAEHGAVWLHFYAPAVEAELARQFLNLPVDKRHAAFDHWLAESRARAEDALLEKLGVPA